MQTYLVFALIILSLGGWSYKQSRDYSEIKKELIAKSDLVLELSQQIDSERHQHELELAQRDKQVNDLQEQINDYVKKIKRLNDDIRSADAARGRLQEAAREAARRESSAQTLVRNVQAASTSCGVLADLLNESDRLAGIYAREADKSRLAGEMCEREYQQYQDIIASITCKK